MLAREEMGGSHGSNAESPDRLPESPWTHLLQAKRALGDAVNNSRSHLVSELQRRRGWPWQHLERPKQGANTVGDSRRPWPSGSRRCAAKPANTAKRRRFPASMAHMGAPAEDQKADSGCTSKDGATQKPKRRTLHHTRRTGRPGANGHEGDDEVVCVERTRGRKRVYRGRGGVAMHGWEGFDMVDDHMTGRVRVAAMFQSYLLPQGFPDSVAPQYASYMAWRGCQYFFGGAMSVFTTRSLLGALGVASKHRGEASAAINWVLKDGAGRLGRFLFARWGRELDCELKQFRLAGDALMEAGAALELSTMLLPRAFLPLACTANLAKNLAAVAASSTRAPIYRTFALQNNLADVTAKGESVANLADIGGTLFGILLTNTQLKILPTFCLLSAGYLYASRREVDSVELNYLNRARLAYAARRYLSTGVVPGPKESNTNEPLLFWGQYGQSRVVLGAQVEEACAGPSALCTLLSAYAKEPYALTYRADTQKVYVVLRDGIQTPDVLRSAFHAHTLLHLIDTSLRAPDAAPEAALPLRTSKPVPDTPCKLDHLFELERAHGNKLFDDFMHQAGSLGWQLNQTMLNPKETRLVSANI